MALSTLEALPKYLRDSPVVTELCQNACSDIWFGQFLQKLVDSLDNLQSLSDFDWTTLGVPTNLASQLSGSLASWLLASVGASSAGFFVAGWTVKVQLHVAQHYLYRIARWKGSNYGVNETIKVFNEVNYLPPLDTSTTPYPIPQLKTSYRQNYAGVDYQFMHPVAPYYGEAYVPCAYLAGWDVLDMLSFDTTRRDTPQWQTLQLILNYHDSFGVGRTHVDYTIARAGFMVAGDRVHT